MLGAALCLTGLAPLDGRAQQSIPPAQPPIVSRTELALLNVSVLDKHGDFVGSLERKNFRVLDNGAEQPILLFDSVESPAQILILVETSPAVYLIHDQHLIAAYALLGGLAPKDLIALATYSDVAHPILGFTPDKFTLLDALGKIQYMVGTGQLNLYDSLSTSLDWLPPLEGKRAVVLLTTGLDESPRARWDALVEKLRGENTDVLIFPVALSGWLLSHPSKKTKPSRNAPMSDSDAEGRPLDSSASLIWEKADDALKKLATMTGGRAYFPESANDFAPMYREIASALRHQYFIAIDPQHDGQFHLLTVQVVDSNGQRLSGDAKRPGYRVLAREGYLAPPMPPLEQSSRPGNP